MGLVYPLVAAAVDWGGIALPGRMVAGSQARRDRIWLARRSHGGLIALIVCLAVVGYMASATTHGLHGMHVFGHGQDDVFSHLLGQEHNDDRSLNRQIPAGAPIDIQVPHGDVTVTPSGDDQIHVQAHLVVYAANDRSARRNLDALAPQLVVERRQRDPAGRGWERWSCRSDHRDPQRRCALGDGRAWRCDSRRSGWPGERQRRPGRRQSRQHHRRTYMCAWAKATSAPMPSREICRSRAGWTMFPSPTCRAGWRWKATSSGTPIWPTCLRRSFSFQPDRRRSDLDPRRPFDRQR